jgi:hypothetical protein
MEYLFWFPLISILPMIIWGGRWRLPLPFVGFTVYMTDGPDALFFQTWSIHWRLDLTNGSSDPVKADKYINSPEVAMEIISWYRRNCEFCSRCCRMSLRHSPNLHSSCLCFLFLLSIRCIVLKKAILCYTFTANRADMNGRNLDQIKPGIMNKAYKSRACSFSPPVNGGSLRDQPIAGLINCAPQWTLRNGLLRWSVRVVQCCITK